MLQKYLFILSLLIYQFGICKRLSSTPLLPATAVCILPLGSWVNSISDTVRVFKLVCIISARDFVAAKSEGTADLWGRVLVTVREQGALWVSDLLQAECE